MGVGYGRNVTQWSKGEYYLANNSQNDLLIITTRLTIRGDDHGNSSAWPTDLEMTGGTNILASTPETDPDNLAPANKGLINYGSDTDVFAFATGAGSIQLSVKPWISPAGPRGGNLDLVARLCDAGGQEIARVDPTDQTYAVISATVTEGHYFLHVSNTGAGDPLANPPGGYTAYGSLGQYFITGRVQVVTGAPPATFTLAASAAPAAWGTVAPAGGSYTAGTAVAVTATPATYFAFDRWTGDVAGAANPAVVAMTTNRTVTAVFAEIVTTYHAVPHWWLASNGWTSDFEQAVNQVGENGMPVWASFVAGLDPHDTGDVFEVTGNAPAVSTGGIVIQWNAVSGHVYSVCRAPDLASGFQPLPGAEHLVWPQASFTDTVHAGAAQGIYHVRVELP
jgi:hypothetical protein